MRHKKEKHEREASIRGIQSHISLQKRDLTHHETLEIRLGPPLTVGYL